ncbi:MAG: FtsX-like permease family protein, partial [Anaerolineae bacterium]|nr:FtsX-like permease family protein [Anaerolineae bacterium]
LDAEVGDTLRINGSSTDFTLTGIVATESEGGVENIGSSMFGYFYLDIQSALLFDAVDLGISTIYVKLPETINAEAAQSAFSQEYDYLYFVTIDDLEAENTEVSDTLNQLVMVMGLVSLLIGGIGIVNTMTVVVSRRTNEIAVLKTIGLEGAQVTVLFLVEAVLLGLIGSVMGVGLGWLAAYVFKGIASVFVAQSLTLRITPEPAFLGVVVGVLVTTIFGFMPTLSAGNVRPNLVLRPSDNMVPRSGRAQTVLALLVVLAALSLVAQPLINDLLAAPMLRLIAGGLAAGLGLLAGILLASSGKQVNRTWPQRILLVVGLAAAGFGFGYLIPALLLLTGTFVVVGVLYVILWTLILVIGRFFPAGNFVDLKVALRSMVATKGRGASTLLALVIGVFTLSLITMLASAISNRLQEMLESEAGGNVMIFASGQEDVVEQIETRLGELDGVNSYTVVGAYNVDLIEFEDVSAGEVVPYDEIQARVNAAVSAPAFGPGHREDPLANVMSTIDERGVNSNLPDVDFYKGRQLDETDTGLPHMVIPANDTTLAAGFDVGDKLTFGLLGSADGERITFEIVGMVDRTGSQVSVGANSQNYAPNGSFPAELQPDNVNAVVDVDEDQIGALRDAMDGISGAFVMETRLLNDLVNRMISRFTSFPILVASLSLVVGGIVIANSVALSTLERRREIGIMKAVGLQRERVLSMILLENGLMGFIGGLIGVGLSSAILLVLMMGVFGGSLGTVIPYATAFSLMGMCILIALAAAILTAWQASGEKPLNVLRYE